MTLTNSVNRSVRFECHSSLFSLCLAGYFGKECVDACQLNPCEHVSTCVRKPSSSHGYTCECGQNHYGQYCENK